MRCFLLCCCVLGVVATRDITGSGEDPLEQWLTTLTLDVGNITKEAVGFSLVADHIVCTNLSVGGITALPAGISSTEINVSVSVVELVLVCTADWTLNGPLGSLGSGSFVAQVLNTSQESSSANFGVNFEVQDMVPQRAELGVCNVSLALDVNFSGGTLATILEIFRPLLNEFLPAQVKSQVCQMLTPLVGTNLTKMIGVVNSILLPPASLATEPIQETVLPGTLNLSSIHLLNSTIPWVLNDLLGLSGISEIMEWGANGDTLAVQGSQEPLVVVPIEVEVGSWLNVTVRLEEFLLNGTNVVDGLQFGTDGSKIAVGVGLGNATQPAVTMEAGLRLDLDSSAPGKTPAHVEQLLQVKLGIGMPNVSLVAQVVIDEARALQPRSLAQWFFGLGGCAREVLAAPVQLDALNVLFDSVTTPLSVEAQTRGHLETDLAAVANNLVLLFNVFYMSSLPGAASRLSSAGVLKLLANDALVNATAPTTNTCISKEEAASVASSLPRIADWRELLGGPLRSFVDNVTRGFLNHNGTVISKAVADLGAFPIPGLEVETHASVSDVTLTGLDQVEELHVLFPTDAQTLTTSVTIACPTSSEMWSSTTSVVAKWSIPSRNFQSSVVLNTTAPCGQLNITLNVTLDMHAALSTLVPSPLACAAVPLLNLSVASVTGAFLQSGSLAVSLGGQEEHPIHDLWNSYPKLQDQVQSFLQSDSVHVFWGMVNAAIASLLADQGDVCKKIPHDDGPAVSDSMTKLQFWIGCIGVALLFAILATALIIVGAIRHHRAVTGNREILHSMSAEVWRGKGHAPRLAVVVVTALLTVAVVFRIASLFFLDLSGVEAPVTVSGAGEMASINLISFSFLSMCDHFWSAGAYLCVFLLMGGCCFTSLIAVLLALIVWLVPMSERSRRKVLHPIIFFARVPFTDVVFFSNLTAMFYSDLLFPLDISAGVRVVLYDGVYVGIVGSVCAVAAMCYMRHLEASLARNQARSVEVRANSAAASAPLVTPVAHGFGRKRHAGGLLAVICMILAGPLYIALLSYDIQFTNLAGDIMTNQRSFSGSVLLTKSLAHLPLPLFVLLLFMMVLAPLSQVVGTVLLVWTNSRRGDLRFLKAGEVLWVFGNSVTGIDLMFAGTMSILTEVNGISEWMLNYRFEALCDTLSTLMGVGCIGTAPTFRATFGIFFVLGFVSFCLAVVGMLAGIYQWLPLSRADVGYEGITDGVASTPVEVPKAEKEVPPIADATTSAPHKTSET